MNCSQSNSTHLVTDPIDESGIGSYDWDRDVKRSSKIRSWIYRFEFCFPVFAVPFVIVTQWHAFNKLHSHTLHVSSAWLLVLDRRPKR